MLYGIFCVWLNFYPKLYSDEIFVAQSNVAILREFAIVGIAVIAPICYVLWLSFCFIILILRFIVFKIPIIELSEILGLHILIMLMWFFSVSVFIPINRMFSFSMDSTFTLEEWGVSGVLVTLLIGMEAIFQRGQILILRYGYEDSKAIQNKSQYFKNILLCFITLIFTTIIIICI